jgi:hypothetical protein
VDIVARFEQDGSTLQQAWNQIGLDHGPVLRRKRREKTVRFPVSRQGGKLRSLGLFIVGRHNGSGKTQNPAGAGVSSSRGAKLLQYTCEKFRKSMALCHLPD